MNDPQTIEAILKSCGWKRNKYCWFKRNLFWHDDDGVPPILTSLDACHEVFEKDAPDEYWKNLHYDCCSQYPNHNSNWNLGCVENVAKATPRQRCLAWLKFKSLDKSE